MQTSGHSIQSEPMVSEGVEPSISVRKPDPKIVALFGAFWCVCQFRHETKLGPGGLEPPTSALKGRCSTIELRT